jgi:hypothetical protein
MMPPNRLFAAALIAMFAILLALTIAAIATGAR